MLDWRKPCKADFMFRRFNVEVFATNYLAPTSPLYFFWQIVVSVLNRDNAAQGASGVAEYAFISTNRSTKLG